MHKSNHNIDFLKDPIFWQKIGGKEYIKKLSDRYGCKSSI
jgi:hypothetical protein